MDQVIDAACLLANIVLICKTRDKFSLNEVREVSIRLERELNKLKVTVNWNKPSVLEAFDLYDDIFKLSAGEVLKTNRFDYETLNNFINEEFNFRLSPEVLKTMRTTIEQTCRAG